ncbi:MAG: porphobilinogen synthase [Candidatus Woesearchaeota archaeon]
MEEQKMEHEIYPNIRLNRLRQNQAIRELLDSPLPQPNKFIYPIFIKSGTGIKEPIKNLKNQFFYSTDMIDDVILNLIKQGVRSVLLFAVIDKELRTSDASYAHNNNGIIQQGIRYIHKRFTDINIFADIGLTGYTNSGHGHIINEQDKFDNDLSLEVIKKIALSYAQCGVTGVAPCTMIDGQVIGLRQHLDNNGFKNTLILSYSTKFDTYCCATFPLQRIHSNKTHAEYLTSHRNKSLAIRESLIDEKEGADVLMVKPGLFYLDIISEIRKHTQIPLATYNVSVEYTMLYNLIEQGIGTHNGIVKESLIALHRAGADLIISYWANQYEKIFLT